MIPLQHSTIFYTFNHIRIHLLQTSLRTHRDFGNTVVQLKPIVKQVQKLLEDRDPGVREETKQLVIEMYRWVGAALKPHIANLKPVQVSVWCLFWGFVKYDKLSL